MTLGLVTSESYPTLEPGDRDLMNQLRHSGIETDPVIWTDPATDWRTYSHLLIRSCWDYHERPDDFTRWIRKREQDGIDIWNPPDLLRWNMDKSYLKDLQNRGIRTIPFRLITPPVSEPESILGGWDAPRYVIKPAVGAGAYHVQLVERGGLLSDLDQFLNQAPVLIQPYREAIETNGEWSLVFFDGVYSHGVRKRPASGDYRVQLEHGGDVQVADPPDQVLESAVNCLKTIKEDWLYARVDGIESKRGFELMELELIEPNLYLDLAPCAVPRFTQTIQNEIP